MFDKYEYSELWEIMTGLSVVIAKHPLKNDNVSMFWYNLYKGVESEIDKRILASD